MRTIAFCEIEPFCKQILKKHWPDVPVFEDVRTLTANDLSEKPDVICGGYPCQPFSVAGKQRGTADDRHLWPEMLRIIKECRPTWVVAENVAGHIRMGLDKVLFDLESEGYRAQPFVIPACGLNAPHRRDRVWIVGYSPSKRIQGLRTCGEQESPAHVEQKLPVRPGKGRMYPLWEAEPGVGRVVNGVPSRVDRIKALGNAVVPQIPEVIGKAIVAASRKTS